MEYSVCIINYQIDLFDTIFRFENIWGVQKIKSEKAW